MGTNTHSDCLFSHVQVNKSGKPRVTIQFLNFELEKSQFEHLLVVSQKWFLRDLLRQNSLRHDESLPNLLRKWQFLRRVFALRAVNSSEKFHDTTPSFGIDHVLPIFYYCAEKVGELHLMVMSHHIPGSRAVFPIPHFEVFLLARDSPDIIERGIHFFRNSGNEGRSAIGLGSNRSSRRAMNVNLSPQSGTLRVAQNNRTHATILETDGGNYCVVDLYTRMIVGIPVAMQFHGRTHEPTHQVEIVRSLTHHHATTFAGPCSTPRVREVISGLAPSQHRHNGEHGLAELAGVNRFLHQI